MVDPASPAAPVAESGDAAATASEQSASTAEQTDGQSQDAAFDTWIRDRAFGAPQHSTLTLDGVVPTAELDAAASGESAPSGDVSPDAVPPEAAGDAGAAQPLGRRAARAVEAQATIESLRAEIETLKSSIPDQVAEANRAADEARAEAERIRSEQASTDALADEIVGEAEEYARLLEIPDDEISNEDYQKRERWKANRRVYRPVSDRLAAEERERARSWVTTVRDTWRAQTLTVADQIGVDRAELAKPENVNVANLMRLAADATEARVRAEQAERISQLERDLSTARGEALGGRRSPITNGAASGSAAGFIDDDTWLRQRAGFA